MNQEQRLKSIRSLSSQNAWAILRVGYKRVYLSVLLLALAGGIVGCSDGRPERVPVSGQVFIDGEPLTMGNIKFVPQNARPSAGKIDKNGHFILTCYDGNDGAVRGVHRVQVSANEIISDSKIRWFAPRKYADFRTSDITIEIDEPTDSLVIELAWEGRKGPYVEKR